MCVQNCWLVIFVCFCDNSCSMCHIATLMYGFGVGLEICGAGLGLGDKVRVYITDDMPTRCMYVYHRWVADRVRIHRDSVWRCVDCTARASQSEDRQTHPPGNCLPRTSDSLLRHRPTSSSSSSSIPRATDQSVKYRAQAWKRTTSDPSGLMPKRC